uniref:histidine kinase n=1 Tax=Bicosoecida sp. CB-2014 TaxID=1486930 RepID=A0A7S1CJP6_9STRA
MASSMSPSFATGGTPIVHIGKSSPPGATGKSKRASKLAPVQSGSPRMNRYADSGTTTPTASTSWGKAGNPAKPKRTRARKLAMRVMLVLLALIPASTSYMYGHYQAADLTKKVRGDAWDAARAKWYSYFREVANRGVLMPLQAAGRDLAAVRHYMVSRPVEEAGNVAAEVFPLLDYARGKSSDLVDTGVYASAYAMSVRDDDEAAELDAKLEALYAGSGITVPEPTLPSESTYGETLVLTAVRPSHFSNLIVGLDLFTRDAVGTEEALFRSLNTPGLLLSPPLDSRLYRFLHPSHPKVTLAMLLPVHAREEYVDQMRQANIEEATLDATYDFGDGITGVAAEERQYYRPRALGLAISLIDPRRLFAPLAEHHLDGSHVSALVGTTVAVFDATPIEEVAVIQKRAPDGFSWGERLITESEEPQLECGKGNLLWASIGDHVDVDVEALCAPASETPELVSRLVLNAGGRLLVFFAISDGTFFEAAADAAQVEDPRANSMRIESIVIGWTLSLLMVAALFVLSYRASSESERAHRRAAEAARIAHEETMSYACHELRNPLHAIAATAALLSDDIDALSDLAGDGGGASRKPAIVASIASLQSDVATIKKSSKLMQGVVDDLLDYARLRRGQLEIVPAPTSIRDIVDDLVDAHRAFADVNLFGVIGDGVPSFAFMDELRVRQVLANGLTNACKLTKFGRIKVVVDVIEHADATDPVAARRKAKRPSLAASVASMMTPRSLNRRSHSAVAPTSAGDGSPPAHFGRSRTGGESPAPVTQIMFATPRSSGSAAYPAALHQQRYLLFEVRDNGPGLRGTDPATLFQPFEQGEMAKRTRMDDASARKSRSKAGTGLGLAISFQLCKLMGGSVGLGDYYERPNGSVVTTVSDLADEKPVSGARFWFTLPLLEASTPAAPGAVTPAFAASIDRGAPSMSPPPKTVQWRSSLPAELPGTPAGDDADVVVEALQPAAVARRAAPAGRPLQGRHYIVVDDESINRRLVSRFLALLGATCAELADGDEVRAYLDRHHPAVLLGSGGRRGFEDVGSGRAVGEEPLDGILMDIEMERTRGDEVCRALRAAGLRLPMVACTGNAAAQATAKYREAGFSAVLTKPYTVSDLKAVLCDLVSPASAAHLVG